MIVETLTTLSLPVAVFLLVSIILPSPPNWFVFALGLAFIGWVALAPSAAAYVFFFLNLPAIPLLLHYLVFALCASSGGSALGVAGMFALLAGCWLPQRTRLAAFWRPKPLPRLKANRRGTTLIELLIVVAVLSILTAGILSFTSATHQALRRLEDRQLALSLAEDEIALLRARESLPEPGRHPIDPELLEVYDFADRAEVEIRPGPHEALREVRVHVRFAGELDGRDLILAALLPIRSDPLRNNP